MLRRVALSSAAALVIASLGTAVTAQQTFEFAVPDLSQKTDPSEARWVVCYTWDQVANVKYVSSINSTTYADSESDSSPTKRWHAYLAEKYELSDKLWGGCNVEESASSADWR